ncbi:hypothetical protein [Persicitalea jodogahamensis]|uniref:Uncharacterized protein n=1 Tax=Persicitalea jodogahamensis TaxID=402147 RepID=A0A8J3D7G9_9BACT|nr:hypothetical protein [Persicitalea jodogahamensis]GHB64273.1 hypothetical protein GCM10007390_17700 [Persicitalea jodogahamensis]
MNLLILAQAMQDKVIAQGFDLARDVTPASMAGYAFAVIVLVVGLYVFFKLYAKEKDYNKEVTKAMGDFNQKSLEVLVSVKGRLDDQQRMGDNITEIRHHMDSLGSKFDALSQKLDRTS